MKITNKILAAGTALLAATVLFAGCGDIIDANDANKNSSIEYTNENETGTYREWNTTNFKHSSASAVITIEDPSDSGYKDESGDGVMGIAWQLTESKNDDGDKLSSFYIVGVKVMNNKVYYYISSVKDCTQTGLTESSDFENETQIVPTTGTFAELGNVSDYKNSDENVQVGIKVEPVISENQNDDGTYDVTFKVTVGKPSYEGELNKDIDLTVSGTKTTVSGLDVTSSNGTTKKITQAKLAYYASVYAGKTLKGSWQLCDIVNEAEVVED